MKWVVYSTKWFRQSLAALPATPEVQQILWAIVKRLEKWPTLPSFIEGTKIQLLKTRSFQIGTRSFPPLRVFYYVDGDRVLELWVETYDERDNSSDEERLALLPFDH